MYASDHRPIKVSFALEPEERGRGRFYFDQRMIGKEGFEEAVIKGWNMANLNGVTHIMDRIASCRKELARWKKGSNINARSNIERLSSKLEVEISKRFPDHLIMKNLKAKLQKLIDRKSYFGGKKVENYG